jgi:hypothetical protein
LLDSPPPEEKSPIHTSDNKGETENINSFNSYQDNNSTSNIPSSFNLPLPYYCSSVIIIPTGVLNHWFFEISRALGGNSNNKIDDNTVHKENSIIKDNYDNKIKADNIFVDISPQQHSNCTINESFKVFPLHYSMTLYHQNRNFRKIFSWQNKIRNFVKTLKKDEYAEYFHKYYFGQIDNNSVQKHPKIRFDEAVENISINDLETIILLHECDICLTTYNVVRKQYDMFVSWLKRRLNIKIIHKKSIENTYTTKVRNKKEKKKIKKSKDKNEEKNDDSCGDKEISGDSCNGESADSFRKKEENYIPLLILFFSHPSFTFDIYKEFISIGIKKWPLFIGL